MQRLERSASSRKRSHRTALAFGSTPHVAGAPHTSCYALLAYTCILLKYNLNLITEAVSFKMLCQSHNADNFTVPKSTSHSRVSLAPLRETFPCDYCKDRPCPLRLTNVSKVDQAVLADVGTGAGLRLHDGARMCLLIADNSQLGGLHTTWQIYIEHCTQFLQ